MSLSDYRERVSRRGNSLSETIITNSKISSSSQFLNSPFLQEIMIEGKPVSAVVTQGKTSSDKSVLLQPDSIATIGSVVEINSNSYIMTDFKFEGINEIYPTGTLKICNSLFPIQTNETRVLLRDEFGIVVTDERGRPVYTTEIVAITTPCIVQSRYSFTSSEKQITLPDGRIEIVIKYTVSENLREGYEFEMYGENYMIANIDPTGVIDSKGILVISAERKV
ncbi:hypothetical protein FZC83_02370 [Rossellomorea marisflavi]|uniref:Uncharacterized protein n=2 Tax=Rossellomorea marisflavi TaxID=189381 RepID=A0A5D4S0I1_9BACI|nr:hypothetical protein FZC83_02370 [Rossellomorea marisflavi]